uniref:Uncharacterized protein n=2 Tax=Oryza brachyantha TaxID=4533 RepID=J3L9U7_ORYBR
FVRSFSFACRAKAGNHGGLVRRALSSKAGGSSVRGDLPAVLSHVREGGSGCVQKDPYPLSEAATKLNALLDEIKRKKLDTVPWVMVIKTIVNFEIVRREIHFRNIRRSWGITAVILAGYFGGYAMEEEKNRKRTQAMVN